MLIGKCQQSRSDIHRPHALQARLIACNHPSCEFSGGFAYCIMGEEVGLEGSVCEVMRSDQTILSVTNLISLPVVNTTILQPAGKRVSVKLHLIFSLTSYEAKSRRPQNANASYLYTHNLFADYTSKSATTPFALYITVPCCCKALLQTIASLSSSMPSRETRFQLGPPSGSPSASSSTENFQRLV